VEGPALKVGSGAVGELLSQVSLWADTSVLLGFDDGFSDLVALLKLPAALLDACIVPSASRENPASLAVEMLVSRASVAALGSRGVIALFGPGWGNKNVVEFDV
jgi:hypothetical protein